MIDDPCASNQPTLNYVRAALHKGAFISDLIRLQLFYYYSYFAFESLQVLKVAYSQNFFHFVFNLQKGAKSQSWALSTSRKDAQDRDFAPLFGDMVQS